MKHLTDNELNTLLACCKRVDDALKNATGAHYMASEVREVELAENARDLRAGWYLDRLLHELLQRRQQPAGGEVWVAVREQLPTMLPDEYTYGSAPDEDDYDEEDALQCRQSGPVLVFAQLFSNVDEMETTVGRCHESGRYWSLDDEDEGSLHKVTHWQPLPAAPTATPPTAPIVALPPASHGGNTRNVLNSDTCAAGDLSCVGCGVCAGPATPTTPYN